ncbi:MAG: hypothetical protein Q8Q09_22090 [Deltaproteobacteria bacterium]|nr:hypothetical protein [Deltaproteobacteria bacterium]
MARDLSREQLSRALGAWACFVGGGSELLNESIATALPWVEAQWDAGNDFLPLILVHDLGHLLLRGREFRFSSARDLASWPEEERTFRMSYEDRVLGRWAVDPTLTEAHIVIAGMAPRARSMAISHAVGLALGAPLRANSALALCNPAHLRALSQDFLASVPERYEDWDERAPDPAWRQWARTQLELTLDSLPLHGRMLRPEDLWELAHLERLPSDSARMALREVNEVVSHIGPVPTSVSLGIRRRVREVPVDADEADQYPAGGFDAISTKGTFENLVRTEVSYVGEGREESGGIDLFDVRFAENELLYYTRDESPLLDARRDVCFVFDRPAEQRFKVPSLPAQTLVLSHAIAVTLQQDLLNIFGPSGSKCRFFWLIQSDADREAAREEHALLSFLLASERSHRRVELSICEGWDGVAESGRVVFSPRPEAGERHLAWVRVGLELWTVAEQAHDLAQPAAGRDLANQLLLLIAAGEQRSAKKSKRAKGRRAATP